MAANLCGVYPSRSDDLVGLESPRRILSKVLTEKREKLAMPVPELAWAFEEQFGRDREEFSQVGRAIAINDRSPAMSAAMAEPFIFGFQRRDPASGLVRRLHSRHTIRIAAIHHV